MCSAIPGQHLPPGSPFPIAPMSLGAPSSADKAAPLYPAYIVSRVVQPLSMYGEKEHLQPRNL